MHELSIALDIIDFVRSEVVKRQLHNLSAVGVRIGALSAVDPESLRFGFTAACRGTELETVQLNIEWVPARIKCRSCGRENTTDQPEFICSACKSGNVEIALGYELEVAYLEANDGSTP